MASRSPRSRSPRSRSPPPATRDVTRDVIDATRSRDDDDDVTRNINNKLIDACTPVYFTSSGQLVCDLLGAKADPNSINERGRTVLDLASRPFQDPIVRMLVGAKADVNANALGPLGEPILMAAVGYSSHPSIVDVIASAKADVSYAHSVMGHTALHNAAENKNPKWVQKLLRYDPSGTSINATDTGDGATPFLYAVGSGNVDTAQVLLSAKSNVNYADNSGDTPLHYAAQNAQDTADSHDNMLHCAAQNAQATADSYDNMDYDGNGVNEKLVAMLLAAKANVRATNDNGETALQVATTEPVRKQLALAEE
jgi:ankyrin repeat protein